MHSSSSSISGLVLASLQPAAPSASQSLEASLALVSRSAAEVSALHILRSVAPGRRSAAQVHEVYSWLSSAHPRLFAEFSASATMGRELCARLRYEAYSRRDILFSQCDRAEHMYCLLRGSVSIWALSPDCFKGVPAELLAATKQKLVQELADAARALSTSRAEVRSRSSPRRGQHSRGRSQSHLPAAAATANGRAHSPMPSVPAAADDDAAEQGAAEPADAAAAVAPSLPQQQPLQRRVSLDERSAGNSPHESRRGSFSGDAGTGASIGTPARSSTSSASSHAVAAESLFATAASPPSPADSLRAITPQSAAGRSSVARKSSTHARSHTVVAGGGGSGAQLSPAASGAPRKLGLSHHHHHGASMSLARSVSPAPHHAHSSGSHGSGAGLDLPLLSTVVSPSTAATAASAHTPSPPSLPPPLAAAAHASAPVAPAGSSAAGVNHTLYLKRSKRSEAKDHLLDPPPVPQLLLKLAEALGLPDPWKWRMLLLGRLHPGGMKQIFGEAGLLQPEGAAGGERSATIRAEEQPTEVLVLGKADFAELLQGNYHKDLTEKFEALLRIDLMRMHVPHIGGGDASSSGSNGSGNGSGNKTKASPSPSVSQAASLQPAAPIADASLASSPSTAALAPSSASSGASLVASQQQPQSSAPLPDAVAGDAALPSVPAAVAVAAPAAHLDLSHPTIGYLRKIALYFEFRTFGLRTQIVRQHSRANLVYCIISGECEIVHKLPMPSLQSQSQQQLQLQQQPQEAEEADSSSASSSSTPRRSLANSAMHARLQQQHLATHSYSGRRGKVTYRGPAAPSQPASNSASTSARSASSPAASTDPSSTLSSRTVLIGLLGAGQCFGELDHLSPASGLHPFGLRTRSLGAPVVLLVISREDFNKRVLAALVDRATLKKLRARDAWRAQRAADLEARGSLAEMLAASAPNRVLTAKSQHQQHLQAMQKQQASAAASALVASTTGPATTVRGAPAAASSSSLSSPRVRPPPARALNPSGQGGWQSIRDLGEMPLHTAVAPAPPPAAAAAAAAEAEQQLSEAQQRRRRQQPPAASSSSSATAHKIAAVVASEELSHYPSLHSARVHALPLSVLTSNAAALSIPPLHMPVAPSNAFVRTQTLQGPQTDRSRSSGGGGIGASEQYVVAVSGAKLLTPSPSTARLLQAHRTSYAALPSSVAIVGSGGGGGGGALEHKEQSSAPHPSQQASAAGGMLYSPSLSQLLPLSPPAAPAPLPSSFALGREVAASLSLRALEHERALLRLRAERLARAGDVARLAALKERAATSRYKLGAYELPSGKQVSRLDQDNMQALAKLGVPLPRNIQQQQLQQQLQQHATSNLAQHGGKQHRSMHHASARVGSYASAAVLAGMLRAASAQQEETEVLPEPFFIVDSDAHGYR